MPQSLGNELVELQPVAFFKWKGKTFNQITSALKKNTSTLNIGDTHNIFRPTPVKLYRKEIASTPITTGNPRVSTTINDFNMPNGYSLSNESNVNTGNCNTLDIQLTANKYDLGGAIQLSTNPDVCFSQADNARRRIRSGGMIKRYNIDNRKKNYYTSSTQYLYDRNVTFDQNQFNYTLSDPSCNVPIIKYKNGKSHQAGVSSSDLIARKRYDTITDSAAKFQSAYGNDVANALAYSTKSSTYTIKDKIGYPLKQTPVFPKHSTEMKKCYVTII
uniref:Uncharacterized protein n=1 Tax=viral metagenome TaxID=1070528 RepID=A0A6C0D678_9ZZZZ